MRFVTRLHACVAAAIFFVVYFSWTRPSWGTLNSIDLQDRIQKAWKGSAHRLVVFGDDWSDIGQYRAAPPPKSTIRDRDIDQGQTWTEALCEQLSCDFIDNFARSIPSNVDIEVVGSVVNSGIFANATAGTRNETLALFDFESQVQQFINFEKRRQYLPGYLRNTNEWSVFTVFFGVWDLLEYSVLEKADAIHAINRSIEELFHNLDILAEHAGGFIKVVIPKVVDVTFLPRFHQNQNDSSGAFARNQHQSVFLWAYWNTALSQNAMQWGHGDIYMPDLNSFMLDQVRAKQLYSKKVTDASGAGKQAPLFDEAEQPCVSLKTDGDLQAAGVEKCFDPARHLFWDNMHLSGLAHQSIGGEAARLVRENRTVNANAREQATQGSATSKGEEKKGASGFNLKLPPGY